MVDDIVDDLIALNYALTGRISSNPCGPIEECSQCGSILEETASGAMRCPVCSESDEFDDEESDDY